jgi:hypothetical protein
VNQWLFVIAAYVVTGLGTLVASIMSWRAMHRAERAADTLSERA